MQSVSCAVNRCRFLTGSVPLPGARRKPHGSIEPNRLAWENSKGSSLTPHGPALPAARAARIATVPCCPARPRPAPTLWPHRPSCRSSPLRARSPHHCGPHHDSQGCRGLYVLRCLRLSGDVPPEVDDVSACSCWGSIKGSPEINGISRESTGSCE